MVELDTDKIAPALIASIKHGLLNWKSSAAGLCGLAIALIAAYTVLPATAAKLTVAAALLRAAILWLQTDAGKTLAVLPGSPEPQVVDSHEAPYDPAAQVVKP